MVLKHKPCLECLRCQLSTWLPPGLWLAIDDLRLVNPFDSTGLWLWQYLSVSVSQFRCKMVWNLDTDQWVHIRTQWLNINHSYIRSCRIIPSSSFSLSSSSSSLQPWQRLTWTVDHSWDHRFLQKDNYIRIHPRNWRISTHLCAATDISASRYQQSWDWGIRRVRPISHARVHTLRLCSPDKYLY